MSPPRCDPLHRLCRLRQHQHQHHHHHHHHHHRHQLLHLHHRRPHHHHCHRLFSPCALHNHYIHCQCHCRGLHVVPPPLPQNPESLVPFPIGNNSNVEAAAYKEPDGSAAKISQDLERLDLDEEEDDEPVFVLTDEWREFFAKSEARRQLEKQQRKKGKK